MKLFGLEINTAGDVDKLREDLALFSRQLEDIGWVKVNGSDWNSQDAAREQYQQMVRRCRLAFIKNPIIGQAVNLTTYYTFGEGVSEPKCYEDEEVSQIVSDFWKNPNNRLSLTSTENQIKLSNKLQYDGELAIGLQVDKDGSVYVRMIDPLTIVSVLKDPNDDMRPLFYKRRMNMKDQYIPDYENGLALIREDKPEDWATMLKFFSIQEADVLKNTYLFHVKQNNDILDNRGIPDVYRALDWMNSNTKINSDAATFINAQAQFAWTKKLKGSRQQVDNMVARQRQNSNLTNPSFQAGSTHVSNEGIEMDPVGLPSSTGSLFEVGIRRTLLMVCAAFGIMEHYFGDPSTGNLATSKSMELPMLKKFLARQKLWESIYSNVLNFQIDMKIFVVNKNSFIYNDMKNRLTILPARDFSDRVIDIDFPPILEQDLKNMADALVAAKDGQLIPIDTARRSMLQAMGVNNIEEELDKEFAQPIQTQFSDPNANPNDPNQSKAKVNQKTKSIKESVTVPRSITDARTHALKLSEKNKTVLAKMAGYRKTISEAYKKLSESVRADLALHMTAGENFTGRMPKLGENINTFIDDMVEASRTYFPQVVSVAEKYVKSKVQIKESDRRIFEKKMDQFTDDQIAWNSKYVDESLAPAIKRKLKVIESKVYPSEAEAFDDLKDALIVMESRTAKYVSALWVVDQRAVKEAAKGSGQQVNFVGVEDDVTCEGCQEALDNNPYPIEDAPVPGDQECLGNCRHALQLVDDEPLTESDKSLLKEAEKEAKDGFKLLT